MNAPFRQPWEAMTTAARMEAVVAGILAGKTYAKIGAEHGANRNQIAGIVNRLRAKGILPRPGPRPEPEPKPKRKPALKAVPRPEPLWKSVQPERAVASASSGNVPDEIPDTVITITRESAWEPIPGIDPIPLMKLGKGRWRWPVFDGDEPRLFCGATTESGHVYCPSHHLLHLPRRKDC